MERKEIDVGNKIILPCSVLNALSQQQSFSNVMIFCLKSLKTGKQTFVGVLEFVADNGTCIIPEHVTVITIGVRNSEARRRGGDLRHSQQLDPEGQVDKNPAPRDKVH